MSASTGLKLQCGKFAAVRAANATHVEAWDTHYYGNKLQEGKLPADIGQYFKLSTVLDGLATIVRRVYGVVLERSPITASELWTGKCCVSWKICSLLFPVPGVHGFIVVCCDC